MIAKGGDDLRQELFAMTLIKAIKNVLMKEKVDIFIKDYDIILNNDESGLIGELLFGPF